VPTILTELLQYDEVDILELLDISTEDLVRRFADRINERITYIEKTIADRTDARSDSEDQEEPDQ